MTIKKSIEEWNNLSSEQKLAAKSEILERLALVDNLSSVSDEVLQKLEGGISFPSGGIGDVFPILYGYVRPIEPTLEIAPIKLG